LVYDLDYYDPLLKLLLDDDGKTAVCAIERVVSGVEERNNLALSLVRIYEARNRAPIVLRTLISHEVRGAPDVDTLFRANSLASKAIEMYMKVIGFNYLQGILEPTLDKMYMGKKSCEVSLPPSFPFQCRTECANQLSSSSTTTTTTTTTTTRLTQWNSRKVKMLNAITGI